MLVLIVDSGECAELTYIQPETKRDAVLDTIMDSEKMRKLFHFDTHHLRYLCTQETFDDVQAWINEFVSGQ